MVADGQARAAAIALAQDIARFPQATMLADRAGVYRGADMTMEAALVSETEAGMTVLDVARQGAARFASGKGRAGRFDDIAD